jgi:hypothetical protein
MSLVVTDGNISTMGASRIHTYLLCLLNARSGLRLRMLWPLRVGKHCTTIRERTAQVGISTGTHLSLHFNRVWASLTVLCAWVYGSCSLCLSPRLLFRLWRTLALDPDMPNTELVRMLEDGLLVPCMPRATRELVQKCLVEVGLLGPSPDDADAISAGGESLFSGSMDSEDVDQIKVVQQDGQTWLCASASGGLRQHRVAVASPARPELVPTMGTFCSNPTQEVGPALPQKYINISRAAGVMLTLLVLAGAAGDDASCGQLR